jgi:ABC-type nitrate/sulfonate/bicarbonate transport system permease component
MELASSAAVVAARPTRRRPWDSQRALAIGSIVGVIVLWEVIARWVVANDAFLVPISAVVEDLYEWFSSGEFGSAFAVSAKEFALGFGCAAVFGLTVGLAMGLSPVVWGLLNPLVACFTATPLLALTPIFIIWFGIGITSKVLMIMFISTFVIIINTATGTRQADQTHLDAARSFGASPFQMILKVRIPSALPLIIAGLRLAMSQSLVGIFVVELFGAQNGIGFTISSAATVFDTERMFSGILLLSATGVLLTWVLIRLEQAVAPWRTEKEKGR